MSGDRSLKKKFATFDPANYQFTKSVYTDNNNNNKYTISKKYQNPKILRIPTALNFGKEHLRNESCILPHYQHLISNTPKWTKVDFMSLTTLTCPLLPVLTKTNFFISSYHYTISFLRNKDLLCPHDRSQVNINKVSVFLMSYLII